MEQNKFKIGGYFTIEQVRDGKVIDSWVEDNIVVDSGLNYILDAALSGAAATTTFYVGLFSNNYTPISSTLITDLVEVNAKYNEVTRPQWVEAGVSAKTVTNSASPAAFTFNASETVYGAFLCNYQTKGNTANTTVIAASKFTTARAVAASDELRVTYTISASST